MLDDKLLAKYIKKFYGHGNLHSNFWFISLEEGGTYTESEFNKRLNIWKGRGCRELEDCPSFHLALDHKHKWFKDKPALQPTWKMYIRLFLHATDNQYFNEIDNCKQKEYIRRYQRDNFGKLDGDMCIMELRPLPSPKLNVWEYNKWSDIPWLSTRNKYMNHITPSRINELRNKIEKHRPKNIFFCSRSKKNIPIWEEIIKINLSENKDIGFDFLYASNQEINYYIIEHSTAKDYLDNGERIPGLGNDQFDKMGKYLNKKYVINQLG